jgi:hypothetical protein
MDKDRLFTLIVGILSVILIGGTITLNWERTRLEDMLYIVSPYIVLFFCCLFVRWLRKVTGVRWVPWLPPRAK